MTAPGPAPAGAGPARIVRLVAAGVAALAALGTAWAITVPDASAGRNRLAVVANPGQLVIAVAPILVFGALAITLVVGRWWRVALGVALTYLPLFAWANGPLMVWEFPEKLLTADVYRELGWSLTLGCAAVVIAVAALVVDGLPLRSGSPADPSAPVAPRSWRGPAPAEIGLVVVGLLVLVVSWCRSRSISVFVDRRTEGGAVLFRHWPELGDGAGMVASILGVLVTVAAVAWVLAGVDRRPSAARLRAQVWLGATIGLVLDLAVRILDQGHAVRPDAFDAEAFRGQLGGELPPVPTTEVIWSGVVVVLLAAVALGAAAWVASRTGETATGESPDATA